MVIVQCAVLESEDVRHLSLFGCSGGHLNCYHELCGTQKLGSIALLRDSADSCQLLLTSAKSFRSPRISNTGHTSTRSGSLSTTMHFSSLLIAAVSGFSLADAHKYTLPRVSLVTYTDANCKEVSQSLDMTVPKGRMRKFLEHYGPAWCVHPVELSPVAYKVVGHKNLKHKMEGSLFFSTDDICGPVNWTGGEASL